jgi:hypothetical protein
MPHFESPLKLAEYRQHLNNTEHSQHIVFKSQYGGGHTMSIDILFYSQLPASTDSGYCTSELAEQITSRVQEKFVRHEKDVKQLRFIAWQYQYTACAVRI